MMRLLLGLMLVATAHSTAAAEFSAPKNLPALALAELVAAALPEDGFGNMGWDYMVSSPLISWQTIGTKSDIGSNLTRREGLVRVRVGGAETRVLRRSWEELPWTLTLWTAGDDAFGPEWIRIQPGGNDPANMCFGTNFRGCTFSAEQALDSPKLVSRFLCATQDITPPGSVKVYSVSVVGKKPSLLVYQMNSGSGGSSSFVEIRPLTDELDICRVRGWMGVLLQSVTPDFAESLGLKGAGGAIVTGVANAAPAEKAKIRSGDVVLRFNGQEVKDSPDLPRIVAAAQVNRPIPIVLWRDGEQVTLDVTLEAKPDTTKPTDLPSLGLQIAPIRPDLQNQYRISDYEKGVLIVEVIPGTAAAKHGLQPGDIIVKVQQAEVATPEEVEMLTEAARKENHHSVLMLIQRQGHRQWVPLPTASDKTPG